MATKLGVGEIVLCALLVFYFLVRILGGYLAAAILAIVISVLIFDQYRKTTLWTRLGVPQPPAMLCFGNMMDYGKKGHHYCDVEWMKKYGPIYGCYMFVSPELIIADKELLKKVLVKDFYNFTNRRKFPLGRDKSVFLRMLTMLEDDEWKNTRNSITPAFTSGKLKGIVHLMDKCIETCCEVLKERGNTEEGIDVKNVMGNLSVEIIAAAAFGMETNTQRNPDNEFAKYASQLSNMNWKDWKLYFAFIFPWITAKLDEHMGIQMVFPGMEEFYVSNLTRILKERRQNPKVDKVDFLQLLINAAERTDDRSNVEIDSAIDHGITTSTKTNWKMSDFDMVAQSFVILLAGQETIANALNFTLYLLAVNKDAQEKADEEIAAVVHGGEPLTYKHMQTDTPYLEAIILESLRLYPPVVRFDRYCAEDYQLTDQLTIPKGTGVCVPAFAIHHDAENYEDPEKFKPERFLVNDKIEFDPYIYMPFGNGPRNCIGMRFAMLEMKLVISNLLRKFKIEPSPSTEPMPLEVEFTASLKPKRLNRLKFVPRK